MTNKSTGWKIPLIFCGIIILFVAVASFFLKKDDKLPDLPDSLVSIAKTYMINLDNEAGKQWQAGIMAATGGFAGNDEKDRRLEKVISLAIAEKRFDAASLAIGFLKDETMQEENYWKLLQSASSDCSTLPWGVIAVYGAKKSQKVDHMAQLLSQQWQNCKN